jgi:hypothetical protein
LLEEFITSKLERALEEISRSSWAKAGQESTSTLLGNDLSETSNEALVICGRIELYSCLDAVRMPCQ